MAQLQEVRVADAPPEIAATYREITHWSGVPIPALLFRHLAARPPLLSWVWQTVRPRMVDGSLQAAAARLMADGDYGPPVHLPTLALHAAGVAAADEATLRAIVGTYNRMNPFNVLAISLCLHVLDAGELAGAEGRQAAPLAMLADIPAAVALEDMPPGLRALTEKLSAYVPQSIHGAITPTLYRHLARWPGVMAIAGAQLLPRLEAGQVQAHAARIAPRAAALARALPPTRAAWRLDADAERNLRQSLDPFFVLIPQLIVVGQLLQAGL